MMAAVGSPYQPGRGIDIAVDSIRQEVGVGTSKHNACLLHLYLCELSPLICLNLTPFHFFVCLLLLSCFCYCNVGLRTQALRSATLRLYC